jgi:PTH1 family peptidyl-tRNA hydrolase
MSFADRFRRWLEGDSALTGPEPPAEDPHWLVVGLGNPGGKYELTPHNLGFLVVDRLAVRNGIRVERPEAKALVGLGRFGTAPVALAKPQSFMNRSGAPVRALLDRYGIGLDGLIVVYDELALPWGSIRVRPSGSAGGHRGVESVIGSVGAEGFARVRLGISPGHPVGDGAKFVLAPFRRAQLQEMDELLDRAAEAVESIIAEGVEKAMARFNRRARSAVKEAE